MDWERTMRGARYHEAGHAVAAYRNGYTIRSVTATADEWRADWRQPFPGTYGDFWRAACVTLAGQLADHVAAWGEMRPEPWAELLEDAEFARVEVEHGDEDARDDHLSLLEHLEAMAADPYEDRGLEALYLDVVEDTRRLLSEHWSEVEAVARALEETGHLGGAEFVRVIE